MADYAKILGLQEQAPMPQLGGVQAPEQGLGVNLGQEGPPATPEEHEQRKLGWMQTLKQMADSDQGRMALFAVGARLLQGQRPGQRAGGAVAEAALAGAGAVAADKAMKRKQETEDRQFQLSERIGGAQIRANEAAVADREAVRPYLGRRAEAETSVAETEAGLAGRKGEAGIANVEADTRLKDRMPQKNSGSLSKDAQERRDLLEQFSREYIVENGLSSKNPDEPWLDLTPEQRVAIDRKVRDAASTKKTDDMVAQSMEMAKQYRELAGNAPTDAEANAYLQNAQMWMNQATDALKQRQSAQSEGVSKKFPGKLETPKDQIPGASAQQQTLPEGATIDRKKVVDTPRGKRHPVYNRDGDLIGYSPVGSK